MKIQDVSSLIAIRNYAYQAVDNLTIKMSREEIKAIQNKVPQLDKKIIEGIIALDLSVKEASIESLAEVLPKFVKPRMKSLASDETAK